jgi:hypothetical protein
LLAADTRWLAGPATAVVVVQTTMMAPAHLKGSQRKFQQSGYLVYRSNVSGFSDVSGSSSILNSPMSPLISYPLHLLVAAFVVGACGCALLIPIVAFKFVAVLFEKDPASDSTAVQD